MRNKPNEIVRPAERQLKRPAGFTLTEIMIALAMVAILLVGISRIFAMTSSTISTGQALSGAVKTQRVLAQTISADVLGVLPTASNTRPYSGIMPANAASDRDAGLPFIQICNFRVPTYLNQSAYKGDTLPPVEQMPATITTAAYQTMSRAIRGIDVNKNGVESMTKIDAANGEMTPIYFYGDRNFRCDTIGFFSRGDFQAQTGVTGSIAKALGATATGNSTLQGSVKSSEAFIWYGHARVFNSDPKAFDRSAGHKAPGEWPQQGTAGNRNNQFADQFVLCRDQYVLVEPVDHDARVGSYVTTPALGGADRKLAEDNTVVGSNDPNQPAMFLQRKWWDPNQHYIDSDVTDWKAKARPLPSPFTINDPVVIFQTDSTGSSVGRNRTLYTNDKTSSAGTSSTTGLAATNYQAFHARTDIAGVGAKQLRQRIRFLEQNDVDHPPLQMNVAGSRFEWWEKNYVSWNTRFWCNPFIDAAGFNVNEPAVNAKSIAQRQQILATGVSQFIIEFSGDFVTQRTDLTPSNRFGEVTATIPDGIPDFVATANGGRLTRWYGLPRDVNRDGFIPADPQDVRTSTDVVPVSRIVPTGVAFPTTNRWFYFERTPASTSPVNPTVAPVNGVTGLDYSYNLDEPTTATSPDASGYVCIWGARDFEQTYNIGTATAPHYIHGGYPTMIRFVIDVVDDSGKLQEPITQELVYNVPDEAK